MTGLAGAAPEAERQVTFLSADHGSMRWSPDGRSLYYFTRDPGRGYLGLFRLDVSTLDELVAPEGSSP
jgi:hypothetical protein